MQSHIKESHGSICGAAGDESHHQRMFGTKLACPLSHLPCPSFLQLWSKDILGTNLSHPISHILVLCFTF